MNLDRSNFVNIISDVPEIIRLIDLAESDNFSFLGGYVMISIFLAAVIPRVQSAQFSGQDLPDLDFFPSNMDLHLISFQVLKNLFGSIFMHTFFL